MRKITFRVHAIQKMFEREISRDDVVFALDRGEVIREYTDDTPYPSRLILVYRNERPIHVVAADNLVDEEVIIITVYEPDPALWNADFKSKKAIVL